MILTQKELDETRASVQKALDKGQMYTSIRTDFLLDMLDDFEFLLQVAPKVVPMEDTDGQH